MEDNDLKAAKTLCKNTDSSVARMLEKGIDDRQTHDRYFGINRKPRKIRNLPTRKTLPTLLPQELLR